MGKIKSKRKRKAKQDKSWERIGIIKRIHVNQHTIRNNKKTGSKDPAITVRTYKDVIKFTEVELRGPSKLVYSPDKPLSCGARLWIETEYEVIGK